MPIAPQLIGNTLTGTLTAYYPKLGRVFEVTGNFTADKSS